MKINVISIDDFDQFHQLLETFIEASPQTCYSLSEVEIDQNLLTSIIPSYPAHKSPDETSITKDRKLMILVEKIESEISHANTFGADLTEREYDVLEKVINGESNPQIAESLNITVNTVKTHLKKILTKLNVENRTQAATYAFRSGMIIVDRNF